MRNKVTTYQKACCYGRRQVPILDCNEFRNGGLVKQDLTSHAGPVTVFMFLNSVTTEESLLSLWDDVKEEEVRSEWVCLCTNHQEMGLQFWRLVSQIAPLLMKGRKEKD
ncbi:hypothetical protein HanXRQr2_Chr14g0656231 [Helianthus annuus]|uniref:Uncharacterized protein n=1 Tax=Helianthus annuus TaxID=4232 RepID=A0A9K3ECW0_HELAN|nr:uncharacterized protein LOC110904241 [Helianthus annuus]XP_022005768.1 uncharacterized protein LOC110904241 [Helianthus annuus]XP_035839249.1 uncharacterized protein LOC110904241 [Helianthus annuus]XP_035839250.1 uncharacterized protein LOC110904241 [Helianthus annuus]KAF5770149.1 hypothetical protein HanXRQr2_Chr14g0656231 [Helianthus annuus]KAJ0465101.1 hypothetical protein HanHA300_Chr14g0534631 [Helianthus annuus]KAJ0486693.1 hypothetical protein HanHA89_Chr14g0582431 [Helianthus annuu